MQAVRQRTAGAEEQRQKQESERAAERPADALKIMYDDHLRRLRCHGELERRQLGVERRAAIDPTDFALKALVLSE